MLHDYRSEWQIQAELLRLEALVLAGLLNMRRMGLLDTVWCDGGHISVRVDPWSDVQPISWETARKMLSEQWPDRPWPWLRKGAQSEGSKQIKQTNTGT